MNLVDLRSVLPDAIFDIRYATDNNVLEKVLYKKPDAKLEVSAARALKRAADSLKKQGLRVVIWDGYRPEDVQLQLRGYDDSGKYILEKSFHPKGLAIDMTLADKDGTYLDMGTDFDDFTPKAHLGASEITDLQARNRLTLRLAMIDAGFIPWPYEWWHYNFITVTNT